MRALFVTHETREELIPPSPGPRLPPREGGGSWVPAGAAA
jgi:hypothetical protein